MSRHLVQTEQLERLWRLYEACRIAAPPGSPLGYVQRVEPLDDLLERGWVDRRMGAAVATRYSITLAGLVALGLSK